LQNCAAISPRLEYEENPFENDKFGAKNGKVDQNKSEMTI